MKIKIENDLYDIVKKIRQIDKNYFVIFDDKKRSFELHNSTQKNDSYALTFPYEELDFRAYNYVHYTKIENMKKLVDEIDSHNALLEKNAIDDIKNDLKQEKIIFRR